MLSEEDDSPFLHHRNPSTLPPAKREGMKFARRVLLTTWDSVLEILSAPLETSISGEQTWKEVGDEGCISLRMFTGRYALGLQILTPNNIKYVNFHTSSVGPAVGLSEAINRAL